MSPITTHILDVALGRPAAGVAVTLSRVTDDGSRKTIGDGVTDADGRIADLLPPGSIEPGVYELSFAIEPYFAATGREAFYPRVDVRFRVAAGREHYHVPLLLSPFGYSTYRGS